MVVEEPEEDESSNKIVQTKDQKRLERIQFVALCWSLFMAGWNDATFGPLNPRIREFYNIGFVVVSLFFLLACLGFTIGAFVNIPLTDRYGFGKVIFFGSLCQVVAYAIQSIAPPWPVFLLAAVLNGAGLSVQDAQANGFVASLKTNPETKMGLLHAIYGGGALVAPLVATQFAQARHWSFHYIVSAGIAVSNAVFLGVVFKLKPLEVCLAQIGQPVTLEQDTSEKSTFKQIMGLRVVHLMAFFILVYVGVEVTFGG
ncbi:MFS general substrate transporter, partial [Pluteus cervinus]